MSEIEELCVSCGKPLTARTLERGFKQCYDCYVRASNGQS